MPTTTLRILALTLFVSTQAARAQMQIHVIDVGQADSILLEFKKAAVLIDAGGESTGNERDRDHLLSDLDTFFARRADLNKTEAPGPNDLLLIGRRHVRDMNTWLHNLNSYVRGKNRCTLKVHPDDANRIGLTDGGIANIKSRVGAAHVQVEISDEIMPGVVSLPHGFGHKYRETEQTIAKEVLPGVSCNDLIDDEVLDVASGTSVVNGAAVQVFPV